MNLNRLFALWGIVALLFLTTGCPSTAPEESAEAPLQSLRDQDRSAGAFAETDPWILRTTDPNAARGNHGIFLGNGYIGATFGATGGAGKDSRVFVAGLYDENETIQPISHWHDLGLPDPKASQPYEQTLDMKRGILTTKMGDTTVTAFVSAANPNLAAIRVEGSAESGNAPALKESKVPVEIQLAQQGNGMVRIITVGKKVEASPSDWENLKAAHEAEWQKRWEQADITIEGDPEAQQLVHKMLFDLMQSSYPGSDYSIAPETLAGEFYKGHIFWDAEIWMFPALVALHPELARPMLDYRYKRLQAAQDLAKKQGASGADFPWESAETGKETAPGGFSQGRHVTAGIGLAVWRYWQATADRQWMESRGYPLLSQIADYLSTKAKKNPQTGKYDIADITGPDEFDIGIKNNTYTNALARKVLLSATEAAKVFKKPVNARWNEVAQNIALPFDKENNRYLKFEGDTGKAGVKQADGELILYPAALPMEPAVAEATFDFHKARVIKNGPAMTSSIQALVAARLGRAEEAENFFRESYRPFMRGPFLLFSEKRSLDRAVFVTGAGGVLQSILYGFGGLDYDQPDTLIDSPPALPNTWQKLTVRGVYRNGKRHILIVTPNERKLSPVM
ncbi:MAG: hypothetical protein OHK0029_06110 [Armatimonadaceae bacterium]